MNFMLATLKNITSIQALFIVFSYSIGSIPTGYILTKVFGLGDIRKIGSGNMGATNVLRTGNKSLALLTLFLDATKGYVATYIGMRLQIPFLCALAAFIGHLFPVWLRFKGGKGVATYLGILWALSLPLALQAFLAWTAFAFLFHYSSVASLLTALLVPLTIWIWSYGDMLYLCIALSILVFCTHWSNIIRLFRGSEPKIGKK